VGGDDAKGKTSQATEQEAMLKTPKTSTASDAQNQVTPRVMHRTKSPHLFRP
jgi:hypothetical protein